MGDFLRGVGEPLAFRVACNAAIGLKYELVSKLPPHDSAHMGVAIDAVKQGVISMVSEF